MSGELTRLARCKTAWQMSCFAAHKAEPARLIHLWLDRMLKAVRRTTIVYSMHTVDSDKQLGHPDV